LQKIRNRGPSAEPSPQKFRKGSPGDDILPAGFGFCQDPGSSSARINFPNSRDGYNFVRTKPQKTNAMKTIAKTLAVIFILMLSMEVNVASAKENSFNTRQEIHYVVNVNTSLVQTGGTNLDLFVVMTDENGRLVDFAKAVRPGLSTYTFSERGDVKGTRIAVLYYSPKTPYGLPLYCLPDSKTGIFSNGGTYIYQLNPTTNPPQGQ
jgi:hypothetical protein